MVRAILWYCTGGVILNPRASSWYPAFVDGHMWLYLTVEDVSSLTNISNAEATCISMWTKVLVEHITCY